MQNLKFFLEINAGVLVMISMIPLLMKEYWAFRIFKNPLYQKVLVTVIVLSLYAMMLFIIHWKAPHVKGEFTLLGVYTCAGLSILLRIWQKK